MHNGEKTSRWFDSLYRPDRLYMRRDLMRRVRNAAWRSEDFSNADWFKFNASITPNDAGTLAPDGHQTADLLVSTGGSTTHEVLQGVNTGSGSGIATTNAPLTFSVFAKKRELEWIWLSVFDEVDEKMEQWFNIATGHLGSAKRDSGATGTNMQILDAGIDPRPDGWWRCWVVVRTGSDSRVSVDIGTAAQDGEVTHDDTGGVWIWGAQIEDNKDFVGPYVRTPASALVIESPPHALTKTIGDIANDSDAGTPSYGKRRDTLITLTQPDGAYVPMLFDSQGRLYTSTTPAAPDTIRSVIADDVSATSTGVKASYTVPAGETALVQSVFVKVNGTGSSPTYSIQLNRGGTIITLKQDSTGGDINLSAVVTLLAADIIQVNVTTAGGGSRTLDIAISVLERP